jgi:hypothetical protein
VRQMTFTCVISRTLRLRLRFLDGEHGQEERGPPSLVKHVCACLRDALTRTSANAMGIAH